jgi:mono/diheme cytochrome c family protein
MLNHRFKTKVKRSGETTKHERLAVRHRFFLFTFACCLFLSGCRMDMQDQPKYKVYRASTFFKDGLSSRPLPEGTVPRGYLRADAALYTGKNDKAQAAQNQSGGNMNNRGSANGGSANGGSTNMSGTNTVGTNAGSTGAMTAASGRQASAGGGSSAANIFEGDVDTFPFPVTTELVNRGQERYQIFCSMCHGITGYGDGMIVRRGFRKPPSYYEDNLRQAPVGHFYDVITKGWGAMPAYADQIPVQDRWAIVAYIRALQLTVPPGQPNGNHGPQTQPQSQSQQQQSQPSSQRPANSRTPNTGGQR